MKLVKVSKGAKIRNRYNQEPHLTQELLVFCSRGGQKSPLMHVRGAFIIYCNCHRNSHAMHKIPMKSNTGISSIFYLSMDTSIVQIGALVFVLHALEVRSFI